MRMRALFRCIASAARARCRPRVAAGVLTPRSSCLPRPLLLTRALLLAGAGSMVLYPASARAATTLQDGLASRGAEVCRLNTYTTLAVTPAALSSAARDAAARARVVAVASPSAVKAWLAVQGDMAQADEEPRLACIGETSASAAKRLGVDPARIYWPDAPGVEGWVDAIQRALQDES